MASSNSWFEPLPFRCFETLQGGGGMGRGGEEGRGEGRGGELPFCRGQRWPPTAESNSCFAGGREMPLGCLWAIWSIRGLHPCRRPPGGLELWSRGSTAARALTFSKIFEKMLALQFVLGGTVQLCRLGSEASGILVGWGLRRLGWGLRRLEVWSLGAWVIWGLRRLGAWWVGV